MATVPVPTYCDVVVAAHVRDQRPEAEAEREQVDGGLDGRGEGGGPPERREVDDLADQHAGQWPAVPAGAARAARVCAARCSFDLLPGQEHEHVLEVGRPATRSASPSVSAVRRSPASRSLVPVRRVRRPCAGGLALDLAPAAPAARTPPAPRAPACSRDQLAAAAPAAMALAVRHDRDRVGQPLGLLDVVGGHQDRDALARAARRSAPTAPGAPAGRGRRWARRAAPAAAGAPAPGRSAAAGACRRRACRHACRARSPRFAISSARSTAGCALGRGTPVQAREHAQVLLDRQRGVEVVELRHHAASRRGPAWTRAAAGSRAPRSRPRRRSTARSASSWSSTCRRRWARAGRRRCPRARPGRGRRRP